jgi:hypothetical protein
VFGAFISAQIGGNAMVWHGRFGLTVTGLLVFRLVWGFVGSTYARFFQFVRARRHQGLPARPMAGRGPQSPRCAVGLACLARCSCLSPRVCSPTTTSPSRVRFTRWLARRYPIGWWACTACLSRLIILLVLAHLAAIAFYVRVKKEVLIMPMITGMKESAGTPATGGGIIAFCLALAVALGAVYGASGAWLPDSVAAPAGSAPA